MGDAHQRLSGGSAVRVGRLVDMFAGPLPGRASEISGIETIFFASSNVEQFDDAAERAAFRERWLGRYLDHWPEHSCRQHSR